MTTHANAISTGMAPAAPSFFSTALKALRAYYTAEMTRRALANLTARELDDIGITAGDIDRIARRGAGL